MRGVEPVAVQDTERGGEERGWDEKVSRFGGKVKIEEVLTYKVAPAWNDEKLQGKGRAWGEERSKGKECVSKKDRGYRRGRGEQQAEEEQSRTRGKGGSIRGGSRNSGGTRRRSRAGSKF